MAALSDSFLPELVELSRVAWDDFDSLLAEEIEVWDDRFSWDFRPSADILRRFQHINSLNGFAVREREKTLGYAYHVCEEHKALIGDLYVRAAARHSGAEARLLAAVVEDLISTPGIRRIESQLMLLETPSKHLPATRYLKRHDRHFMEISIDLIPKLREAPPPLRTVMQPWSERNGEEIAHLIAASYRGHVDSEINDQYRTIPGARRFLMNIIKYPGCGRFLPACSVVSMDEGTGRICGVCLASLVSANSGHITQLCVLPGVRGSHIGYALLRESLRHLMHLGCQGVSLTVTCSNVNAIRLYESLGFEITATFPALVWEGF